MNTYTLPNKETWPELMVRATQQQDTVDRTVANILSDIKKEGDIALRRYTKELDGATIDSIAVPSATLASASIDKELADAILQASDNIGRFHNAQKRTAIAVETMPGVQCWRKQVPIQRVGLYVPGGSAPLLSTLLMLGIPAQLAGCAEIVICTPPKKDGSIPASISYIAHQLGIQEVYSIGGAQAVAAMSYGTETIRPVSKIFGPGNRYVTAAKMQVQQEGVAIDMPAGPSELLIIADETAHPNYIAADLLSQAEHGPDSQVILLSTSNTLIRNVSKAIESQLQDLPRADTARAALANSRAIQLVSITDCLEWSNAYAPEHLIINCQDASTCADQVTAAGSVFIGPYSCESAGDYASGTNHTLPTNGAASAYSGVSLDSFCKYITYQSISKEGLNNIGPTIMTLARAEQLEAHARAVSVRQEILR